MDLKQLTSKELIILNETFSSKKEILTLLAKKLYDAKKITNEKEFLHDVLEREKLSPTNIGMELAIPHGKSASVKSPCFAVARLKNPITYWDETHISNEDVRLVFLIAAPKTDTGDEHLHILTKLTAKLSDEEIIQSLLQVNSPDTFLEILSEEKNKMKYNFTSDKLILGITACPAGIAHTYMAAEALENAGRKLGIKVRIEKQGANGIEDAFTLDEINNASAIIYAVDVAVKHKERFDGIPNIEVSVASPLKNAENLIKKSIEISETQKNTHENLVNDLSKGLSFKDEAKRAVLTGISHTVPIIISAGMMLAIAVLMKQIFKLDILWEQEGSWLNMYRKLSGGLLGTLMVPILAAYISFSISDKPGLAPGFAAGFAANMINSGFLGGLVGGFLAGYLMKYIKKHIIGPKTLAGFFNFFLYPVLGTFIVGTLMMFVVGKPVAWLNISLTNGLEAMQGRNIILLAAIIGAMVSFDLGGPVNKAAYAFCIATMTNGNFVPYAIFASAKMVSAFATTFATKLKPAYFLEEERELGNSTWILGLAGITEGAIPLALNDPLRVLGSFIIGSMITGGIVGYFNLGLNVPGAGILSLFFMQKNGLENSVSGGIIWLVAGLIGAIISTVLLLFFKSHKQKKLK